MSAVQSGKDANINITGVTMTDFIVTKWTLNHSPTFHTHMEFGDGAPRNTEIHDNWTVTVEGVAKDGVATFPDVGANITDLDLILEDGATDSGYTCSDSTSCGKVSTVDIDVEAVGVVSGTFTIVPNGVAMTSYGTVT